MIRRLPLASVALLVAVVALSASFAAASFSLSPGPPVPICRSFSKAKSEVVAPWSCDTPDGTLKCTFSLREVAVVLPLNLEESGMVERLLYSWSKPGGFPCSGDPTSEGKNYVDLVMILTSPETTEAYESIKASLMSIADNFRRCFRDVRVEHGRDYLGQDPKVPLAKRSLFFSLFGAEQKMVQKYSHFFWMHSELRAVRRGWVEALLMDVVQEYKEMWQKNSIAYYDFDGDYRLNWNAFYKLGDKEFGCILEKLWPAELPTSDVMGVHQFLVKPENRWHLHKSIKSELVVRAHWRMYTNFSQDHPKSFFLTGTNAWADTEEIGKQYGSFESE